MQVIIRLMFENKKISKSTNTVNLLISYFGSLNGNRTRDSALRGRCLNRLTMRPYNIIRDMKLNSMSQFNNIIFKMYFRYVVTLKSHTRTIAGGFFSICFYLFPDQYEIPYTQIIF